MPRLLAGLLGACVVTPAAAVHGGYFPTSWGWQALLLSAIAATALIVREQIRLGQWELVALGAVAGLFAWTLLSTLWAPSSTWPIRESERMLVYVCGLAAILLVVRHAAYRALIGGVWIGITAICCYSLATRLFPGWQSTFDPFGGYRLSEPIGYWNGLGILAAIGFLLALGVAARARPVTLRAVAAASIPAIATTLYFTYSRGAWLALGVGVLAALALDGRRLQLVTLGLGGVSWAAVAVLLASRLDGLTHVQASRASATHDGRRLAVELLVLSAAAALSVAFLAFAEKRIVIHRYVRTAYGSTLLLALATGLAVAFSHYGDPVTLVRTGYNSLNSQPPVSADLNRRLFNLSSPHRVDHWRVAWKEYEDEPVLGSGGGTYEQHWLKERRTNFHVRNAHNLYLETLATLGPIGLLLLATLLAAPLVAAIRVRGSSLVPAACGAYAAFLVHAALDWDWQLPAVTLAALSCGAAMLVRARSVAAPLVIPMRVRVALAGVALMLFAAAFIGLKGNLAIAASNNAADDGNWAEAAREARTATSWAPWSAEGWRNLGEAQFARGDRAAARASFRKAIAKDPNNWSLWADLAEASTRRTWRSPALEALRLNPRAPELAEFRDALRRGR